MFILTRIGVHINQNAHMVTKAILTADGDAKIQTNLTDKTLQLSTELSSAEVMEVLTEAGYPATEVKASCCNPANTCHSA